MNQNWQYFFWDLLQYLINGIGQGSIYALVALGYTMVYGIIRLVNFAHGEFIMIGAFIGFYTVKSGMPLYMGIPFAMLGSGIIAVVVERLVYRPIRSAGRIAALITAIGTSMFFQYFGQYALGADIRALPTVIEEKTINFGELYISSNLLLIVAVTFFVMIFLWWLTHFTKIGKAMRATSFNLNAAELMGINTNQIISFTFFLGAALAGLAGVLIGNSIPVEPMMGVVPGLKAFVSAVIGGIGIIPGAALGGLILGIAENLVTGFYKSTYRDAVAFLILIIILLVRPNGILGKNTKEKV